MPYRLLAATELAELLRALAHPRRIQILEELYVAANGTRPRSPRLRDGPFECVAAIDGLACTSSRR